MIKIIQTCEKKEADSNLPYKGNGEEELIGATTVISISS
jgi:hypothetical protein